MNYTLNTHYAKNIDLTWAILGQMSNELTRVDVLGIVYTHQINEIWN